MENKDFIFFKVFTQGNHYSIVTLTVIFKLSFVSCLWQYKNIIFAQKKVKNWGLVQVTFFRDAYKIMKRKTLAFLLYILHIQYV